jgi:L-histidine N-alpha-methyltransferase
MRAVTPTAPRLEIRSGPHHAASGSFADDVRAGLTAERKHLSSKYFYDELGSALFEAITVVPEYYLTRAETEILHEYGWEMVRAIGNPLEFVELGSGSAAKTRILIEEALRVQRTLRYSPIDISREALQSSAHALVEAYPNLHVSAYAGDYFGVLESAQLERRSRMMVLFMGSNIGNYEPPAAAALLRGIAACLKSGDGLLLGTDMKKEPRILEAAYDDAAGVTAAFNKNLLARINRELGGNFDVREFQHVAGYDEESGAVRSHLTARIARDVRIEALGLTVRFEAGERIHTESSFKYSPRDLERLARAAGLKVERFWTDAAERFRVNLLVK